MDDRDFQALELSRAGNSLPEIRDALGFKSVSAAAAAVARARKRHAPEVDAVRVRDQELDRLAALQRRVWGKAQKGDVKAIELAIKLSEARIALAGVPAASTVADDVEKTLSALELTEVDAAAAGTARRLAQSIDAAAGTGNRTLEMKALYLVPHLMNVLSQLGATPAARGEVGASARAAVENPGVVDDFEEFKRRKGKA